MATVEEGIKAQIRNIEAEYGRSMRAWALVVRKSGLTKHAEVVAMLKRDHGLSHGAAHRVALTVREGMAERGPEEHGVDPVKALFGARRAHLLPIVDALLATIRKNGEHEIAPKKGYVSLRRRKQFAMLKPAAAHVDLGLVLPGVPSGGRLESAATFNALFTHRVRVKSVEDIDPELKRWLQDAHRAAG
jgi:hypothetical protein